MPTFLLERDSRLPLCQFQVTVRHGASHDGPSALGLCHFSTELMRRGAGGRSRTEIDEKLDDLGAHLNVLCGHDSVTFSLISLKEKIPQALSLLADVLLRPHFDETEAALLRRETMAILDEQREDDTALAAHFFAKALYGKHPYGHPLEGTRQSIPHLSIDAAQDWYSKHIYQENLIVGAAGDVSAEELNVWFTTHLGALQSRTTDIEEPLLPSPSLLLSTHRVIIIDKPERTQSQIFLGQMGPAWNDPHFLPLQIGTTAFGGTFTARLMNEVRSKRGLSYGASAQLGEGKQARGLVVHVFPSAQQTPETIDVVLSLYADWAQGLSLEEMTFAQSYLSKSYAFTVQTPEQRLQKKVKLALSHRNLDEVEAYPRKVTSIEPRLVNQALAQSLTPNALLIVLVATAREIEPLLRGIPALKGAAFEVQSYLHESSIQMVRNTTV